MCELCDLQSGDPVRRTAVRDGALMNAERMERLATYYRQMAYGEIKPHTKQMEPVALAAKAAIRLLVDDFL